MTLLVLAHAGDDEAERLARELNAQLVTPRDLSRRGWRHYPVGGGDDTLPIGNETVAAADIHGVITRLTAVQPADLPHIHDADRGYIAAEMTAFLLSFLLELRCPVMNRPTACSLMGPGWTPVRWRAAAHAAGFTMSDRGDRTDLVVVVADQCFGAPDEQTATAAGALAHRAGVQLLGVEVAAGSRYVGVHPWCHLASPALAAVREQLYRAAT